jgi:hypothetical protein
VSQSPYSTPKHNQGEHASMIAAGLSLRFDLAVLPMRKIKPGDRVPLAAVIGQNLLRAI